MCVFWYEFPEFSEKSHRDVANWLESPKYSGKSTNNVAIWLKYWTFLPRLSQVFREFDWVCRHFGYNFSTFGLILANIPSFRNNPQQNAVKTTVCEENTEYLGFSCINVTKIDYTVRYPWFLQCVCNLKIFFLDFCQN